METFHIGEHQVGVGNRPLIVSEVGFNHNGSVELAERMVAAAADCGCDMVKFQAFHAGRLFAPAFVAAREDGSRWTPADLYRQYELSDEAYDHLARACRRANVGFVCTPFDLAAVDMLKRLDLAAYKIASGDLTHETLIRACAATGRPVIISTGMGRLADVEAAVRFCQAEGNDRIVLLHCTSSYPCPPADVHLRALELMRDTFACPVGLSDHTQDAMAALAATALGAAMIEKHFTTDRTLPGFDQAMSADPEMMRAVVAGCRQVHASLGEANKAPRASERQMQHFLTRSVVYARDLPGGTVLSDGDLDAKRPGSAIPVRERSRLIGRRLRQAVKADAFARWADLDGGES